MHRTHGRIEASAPLGVISSDPEGCHTYRLTGTPTERFEAYTACPQCKTLNYHQLRAIPPLQNHRTLLTDALMRWEHVSDIDPAELSASLTSPDEMFESWLKSLRIVIDKSPNPRYGIKHEMAGWFDLPVRTIKEPEFLTTYVAFPFPEKPEDAFAKYRNYDVVRYCERCLCLWGQK